MKAVERWVSFLTQPLVMIPYLTIVVACYLWVDQPLALHMHALKLSLHYPVLGWITQLGRSIIWLLILPALIIFFRYMRRVKQSELRLGFIFCVLIVANGISFVLKNLLGRARPDLLFSEHIFGFYGYNRDHFYHSFPSGHTTQVTAAVLSLALLFPRQRWLFLILGCVVVATRVLLTYHYLSDVLATAFLVVLEFKLLLYIVAKQCPLYWKRLGIT